MMSKLEFDPYHWKAFSRLWGYDAPELFDEQPWKTSSLDGQSLCGLRV
jgi:hypothetical protein